MESRYHRARPSRNGCIRIIGLIVVGFSLQYAKGGTVPQRIFDFNSVSPEGNPCIARIDDSIEIPASELRGFIAAEQAKLDLKMLNDDARGQLINELIDEYLLIAEARRLGADRTELFQRRMDHTRKMLLAEFLVGEQVGARAKTAADYQRLLTGLRDELFAACPIEVSNEVHVQLAKAAADLTGSFSKEPTRVDLENGSRQWEAVADSLNSATLARYNGNQLGARKVLVFYLCLPTDARPDIATQDGLAALLKELLMPDLMAEEAMRRGLEQRDSFQFKVVENENSLLRMFMRDRLQRRVEPLKETETEERLTRWYRDHRRNYSSETAPAKAEDPYQGQRDRVSSDWLEDRLRSARGEVVSALRKLHTVTIDRDALRTALAR